MPPEKKLKDAVILFASIEREHHDKLRTLSFQSHRSIADLTREAIESYVSGKELKTVISEKKSKKNVKSSKQLQKQS